MSVTSRLQSAKERATESGAETLRTLRSVTRLKRALFGDDLGLALFLGSILFFSLLAHGDVFINDSYAIENTLFAVSQGDIVLTEFPFGPSSGDSPGVYRSGDKLIGRNYGQVTATLPVYLVLLGLTAVGELQSILLGLWSLLLFSFLVVAARLIGVGSARTAGIVSVIALVVNVALGTPLDDRFTALVSLQITTMIAAGAVGVVLYRMFRAEYGRKVAAAAGIVSTVATPVALFATVPKRHSFSAFFLLLGMALLYQTYATDDRWRTRWFRGLTYTTVGAMAWIHSLEGLVLLLALVAGDAAGGGLLRPREAAFAITGTVLSLVPFLITNLVATGNPLGPPRHLPDYNGQPLGGDGPTDGDPGGGETGGGETGGGETGGGETGGDGTPTDTRDDGSIDIVSILQNVVLGFVAAVESLVRALGGVVGMIVVNTVELSSLIAGQLESTVSLVGERERVADIFLRRGFVAELPVLAAEPVNLSLLESMPAVGGLVAVVGGVSDDVTATLREWADSPYFPADVTGLVYAVLLILLTLPQLPGHTMFTVRYLHPLYPLCVYLLVRIASVRTAVERYARLGFATYGGVVGIGAPVYAVSVWALAAVPGEAVQLYARTAFVVGVGTVVLVAAGSLSERPRSGLAVVVPLAVAFGIVTVYVLGFSVVVYGDERNMLPVVEMLSEQLRYTG